MCVNLQVPFSIGSAPLIVTSGNTYYAKANIMQYVTHIVTQSFPPRFQGMYAYV